MIGVVGVFMGNWTMRSRPSELVAVTVLLCSPACCGMGEEVEHVDGEGWGDVADG